MYIDKQNTFFYKQAVTANVNLMLLVNGNGGMLRHLCICNWLDKDVTGTPLFNFVHI